jgi:hypothetical protein
MITKNLTAKLLIVTAIIITIFSCVEEEKDEETYDDSSNTCDYTQWTGTGNCNSEYYPVYTGVCAPKGYPFYNTKTTRCYTTCTAAYDADPQGIIYRSNENGNTGSGSDTGTGSGSSCASMNSYVAATTSWINNCGSSDDLSVKVKNNSSQKLAIRIAIKKKTGQWDCGLQYGVAAGSTFTYWSCHSTGDYRVYSMLQSDNDSGCKLPACGE